LQNIDQRVDFFDQITFRATRSSNVVSAVLVMGLVAPPRHSEQYVRQKRYSTMKSSFDS